MQRDRSRNTQHATDGACGSQTDAQYPRFPRRGSRKSRLGNELQHDVFRAGSNGFPQTDFSRPFIDRDEHERGNNTGANQYCDPCNQGKKQVEHPVSGPHHLLGPQWA